MTMWDSNKERIDWKARCKGLKGEVDALKSKLSEAVELLKAGKIQFTPNTTNSIVDDFINRYDEQGADENE